jgi:HEAT repeat protein
MPLLKLGEPSPAWPYIKTVAKFMGLGPLADLQDELAQEQHQDPVKALLKAMSENTAEILQLLRDKANATLDKAQLDSAAQDLAEWIYLKRIANKYYYADFKGIQESKFVPLPLDDIFIELKAFPEERESSRDENERVLRAQLEEADESHRPQLLAALEETDTNLQSKPHSSDAQTPAQMLKNPGTVVLLGGPGSGKTTLVKRLTRSCALGQTELQKRFPNMPWCFPIVIPITQFVDHAGDSSILEYAEQLLRTHGDEALLARYNEHFQNGHVLFLLDGLDEVADAGQRIAAARAVDDLSCNLDENRIFVTSRRVGYAACRLSVPATHYILAPFSPNDIATFAEHWYIAFEKSQKGDKADLAAARQTAKELNTDIERNTSVASLATNPLMLTIIALIKHRAVELPHRRVELYRIALDTLLESWNLARSLAQSHRQRFAGETPRIEQTREVWSYIAFWMHSEANREVSRQCLHDKLVEVLISEYDKNKFDAAQIAGSYLDTATETSGLLEARGANTFAFIHQSFQEYLAAYRLVRPASMALSRIQEHCHDPRWHEVIRLGIGHLSITVGEKEIVTAIIKTLLNSSDPLEPYLCNALRLALGCLADQVGLRQQQVDDILVAVARKIQNTREELLRHNLLDALKSIETPPATTAQSSLIQLLSHVEWQVRMEAMRILTLTPRWDESLSHATQLVFHGDPDLDVRAYAAWGLWRQGQLTEAVIIAVAQGLASSATHMQKMPSPDFWSALVGLLEHSDNNVRKWAAKALSKLEPQNAVFPALLKLLEHADPNVRWRVVESLANLGPQPTALPALLGLLEDAHSNVRWRAAVILGNWGLQPDALSPLLKLLDHVDSDVRLAAAATLCYWGHQSQAFSTLHELLGDTDTNVRLAAAVTLCHWGHQSQALPTLQRLLKDADQNIRWQAAEILGNSGFQSAALPTLHKLLDGADSNVRWKAAETLGNWGHQSTALPTLQRLLEDADPNVRWRAAETLSKWGPQPEALPAVLELLEYGDPDVRRRAAQTLSNWGPHPTVLPALLKFIENIDPEVRWWIAQIFANWEPQPTALPALLTLLEDADANVRQQAAQTLGNWGRHEKIAGPIQVAATILHELAANKAPKLLAAFQPQTLAANGSLPTSLRADLADLLKPQFSDSPRLIALRSVLFQFTWHNFATTA